MAETVAALVRGGVPFIAHVGLSPQTAAVSGGFRAQGRTARAAVEIVRDAAALEVSAASQKCAVDHR